VTKKGYDKYAKAWVSQFNKPWFVALNCMERGFWMQLYTWAKLNGDTGTVIFRSYTAMGEVFGLDRRTASKVVTNLQQICHIYVTENEKSIVITIPQYEEYQYDTVSGGGEISGKFTPSQHNTKKKGILGEEKKEKSPNLRPPDVPILF
jgi:hypothetical protein